MNAKTESGFVGEDHLAESPNRGRNRLITGVLGMLIVASLVLAYQTRNRTETTAAGTDSERIESVDGTTTMPPNEQDGPESSGVADGLMQGSGLSVVGGGSGETTVSVAQSSTLLVSSTVADDLTTTEESDESTSTTAEATTTTLQSTTATEQETTTTEAPATTVAPAPSLPPTTAAPVPSVALVNGGFDRSVALSEGSYTITSSIPGWISQTGKFEVWDAEKGSVGAINGSNLLELNAENQGLIYQDFATTPGSVIRWEFFHRGRNDVESLEFQLGSSKGAMATVQAAETGLKWQAYTGNYTVPEGQTTTRIVFRSLEPGGSGNLIDAVSVSLVR